uniref:CSON003032 protein n=1 Tax=Culicoides sonorensis TaxID=179676 RepID=A0A336LW35_CULSO
MYKDTYKDDNHEQSIDFSERLQHTYFCLYSSCIFMVLSIRILFDNFNQGMILGKNDTYQCSLGLFGNTCVLRDLNLNSSNKHFKLLTNQNFNIFRNVEFSNSKLEVLTSDICDSLSNLHVFFASNLGILVVEENALKNCKKLQRISFNNNSLTQLPSTLFEDNSELTQVDLSENQLNEIDKNLFKNNDKLERVILTNNNFTYVPPTLFEKNSELLHVLLLGNPIKELHSNLFKNNPILKLVAIGNFDHHHFFTTKINNFLDSQLYIDANLFKNNRKLTFVMIRYISAISLNNNNLTRISPTLFDTNVKLSRVELDNNHIKQIDEKTFYYNDKLTRVYLANTQSKTGILDKIIIILGSSGLSGPNINLTIQSIKRVQKKTKQRELVKRKCFMILGKNDIYQCSLVETENKCVLRDLNLNSSNKHFKLRTNQTFDKIKNIEFSNSKVEVLTSDVCDSLSDLKLQVVLLINNSLTQLPLTLFEDNSELAKVILSNNQLNEIDKILFKNNPKLKTVALNNNNLIQIPSSLFELS